MSSAAQQRFRPDLRTYSVVVRQPDITAGEAAAIIRLHRRAAEALRGQPRTSCARRVRPLRRAESEQPAAERVHARRRGRVLCASGAAANYASAAREAVILWSHIYLAYGRLCIQLFIHMDVHV